LKTAARNAQEVDPFSVSTTHHLLFCEHHPVYTLGKSGDFSNVLLNESELMERNIEFFRTNRGGDITFHGPGQIVGYPIFDLEKFTTDIGVYLRNIEEVIIKVLSLYGIKGFRSKGETGVWLDPDKKGRERKICAIGVRCSRWITMHGFALNVNTGMDYFSNIVPCGIPDKQVTSLSKELGASQDMELVRTQLKSAFQEVFQIDIKD
jgi:lipoyl(octanoyl) transferase